MPEPWPYLPIKPLRIGDSMTVCIAAICKAENALILASDRMISIGGYMSADDLARKTEPLYYHWYSQFAANDISSVVPIHEAIGRVDECHVALECIADMTKKAYKEQRLSQIEDEILGAYGLSWEDFRENGKSRLNERDFEIVTERIRSYDLSLEMLVAGFDGESEPHIFAVSNPGKVSFHDKLGFWAIGSGQHLAMGSLFSGQYDIYDGLDKCIAQVLSANFAAESAEGVGDKTHCLVYTGKDESWLVPAKLHQAVKSGWHSLPRIPTDSLPKIRKFLDQEKENEKTNPTYFTPERATHTTEDQQ